jgi:O-antigen/teichoic acid export membrane protein
MPLLGKEYGNNNFEWINKIYSSFLVLMAVIGGGTWVCSIIFYRDIITLWTSSSSYAGLNVVIALGGYSYLLGMSVLNSGILNSFNYSGITPFVAWGEAIIKIFFSIWLGKILGIQGVAIGTFLGSLFSQTWVLPILIKKRSRGKIFYDFPFLWKHFTLAILPCVIISVLLQVYPLGILFRLFFGIIISVSYLCFSYLIIPNNYRAFFLHHLHQILNRISLRPIKNFQ